MACLRFNLCKEWQDFFFPVTFDQNPYNIADNFSGKVGELLIYLFLTANSVLKR